MRTDSLLAVMLCVIVSSCSSPEGSESGGRRANPRAKGHGPRDVPGSADLPPGQPGMPNDSVHAGGGGPTGKMPANGDPPGAGVQSPLRWQAPEGWRAAEPSSSMRIAEWTLAKVAGDAENAEVVVFHFPGGGDVQSNIDRWFGQFTQPDGRPSAEVADVKHRTVSGLRITVADVSGTFDGGGMMGMMAGQGSAAPKPDYRLLAAIVETPAGPWFFKLIGPKNTVEHWRPSFDTFLGSLHQ